MSWWKIVKGKGGRALKSLRKALKKKWNGNLQLEETKGKNKGGHHKLRVTDTVTGLDIYPIIVSASPSSRGRYDLVMSDIRKKFKKEHKFDLDKEYPRKKKRGKKK